MASKKILIADDSLRMIQSILSFEKSNDYIIKTAKDGTDCLEKIESFQPHLILLKLMLPQIHGIEILHKIRSTNKNLCVIITSENSMTQDYNASVEAEANYFLLKPFTPKEFFLLVDRFFENGLTPDPFIPSILVDSSPEQCYSPSFSLKNYIKFWGTRGSISVSGSTFNRFGGDTSCFELYCENQLIIIDAGTGIRSLGTHILQSSIKTIHLFLSHTHWDHIIGIPFFDPFYHPDYKIYIYAPIGFRYHTKDLMTKLLAYDFFPVRLDELKADIEFVDILDSTSLQIGDLTLSFHYTFHPGIALAFKIKTPQTTIGYATDNELLMGYHKSPNLLELNHPLLEPYLSFINFFSTCDLIIHEAQYTQKEYMKKVGWGHSSIANATVLLKYSQAKKWIVTHHDPSHTDHDLLKKQIMHKQILKEANVHCDLELAYDGCIIPIF